MDKQIAKNIRRYRRKARVRSKISGTAECPRLSVFKSNRHVFVQLIDDQLGKTLASVHSQALKDTANEKAEGGAKIKAAFAAGKLIAERAKEAKIDMVVFDRGSYLYHGRVKALAEGAREGGLNF
jgi:large subunit ribosomal protein L18